MMTAAFWTPEPMALERPPTYYSATLTDDPRYPRLEGSHRTDIVVIGGGFTGVNTALELAERGFKVVLVEQHRIGWGASGRNGGQVTGSLSGDTAMQKKMRATLGASVDDFIWNLRFHGHDVIESRIARYGIDCDLKKGHLETALKPAHLEGLRAMEAEAMARGMAHQVRLLDARALRERVRSPLYIGGLENDRNLHLHPLKLCVGEARAAAGLGVTIFEGTQVTAIRHGARPVVETTTGSVEAASVVIAGDVYHHLEDKKLSGLIFPAMGAIVTTEPLGARAAEILPRDQAVYDCRFVLDYYRLTRDGRLLFGGGCHYSGRDSRDPAAELRPAIEATFPTLKGVAIEHGWTCAMGIVMNRIPQLGKLSEHVWYAQGYSGHGIATSHIVGEIMAEAVGGELNRFEVFSSIRHTRIPFGRRLGNALLSLGMTYYQLLERLR